MVDKNKELSEKELEKASGGHGVLKSTGGSYPLVTGTPDQISGGKTSETPQTGGTSREGAEGEQRGDR